MKRNPLALVLALTLLLTAAASSQEQKPAPEVTYVRAGQLFDSVAGALRSNVVLVIEGERIQRVAPAAEVQIPRGARVIDLSQATVLPGLIDMHTHLGGRADRYDQIHRFRNTPYQMGFNAVVHARRTLEAGFTTVREVGGAPFLSVDLRGYIEEGFFPGPRIVASGPGISMTGGHGDLNRFSPWVSAALFPAQRNFNIADGTDQVRQQVRAQHKYGVDLIKVLATGGVLSYGTDVGAAHYTLEELRAAAETAHGLGMKITAHAHATQGIKNAVLAGFDSVEHVSFVDDEGIRLAAERGTYFVMDIYNTEYLLGEAIQFGLPQENIEKERRVSKQQREGFRKAVQAGVKMAFGSDSGVYPHGQNGRQFRVMVEFGMTPAQAIQAATINAADLLGRTENVGSLREGRFADLIAVRGNPLENVRLLEDVGFVMKGGKVFKDKLTGQSLAVAD